MSDFSGLALVIEPSDLSARLDARELILVDLTSSARYAEGHIPGARFVDPKRTQLGQPPAPGLMPPQAALEALFGEPCRIDFQCFRTSGQRACHRCLSRVSACVAEADKRNTKNQDAE